MRSPLALALAAALSLFATGATAQELVIGRGNEPQSIDPHYSRSGPNQMTAAHVFDRLIHTDANLRTVPGLAESWESLDRNAWLVRLRKGVRFHDGAPFTAEDVVFSLARAGAASDSPAPFTLALADLDEMEIVDDHTIRFTTKVPSPLFIENIGTIHIVSKAAAEGMTAADFDAGKAAIGTGPYKFVAWSPGESLQLNRNDDYWGDRPAYAKVTMRFLPDDESRVAALLSGDADLIDLVPPAAAPALERNPAISVYRQATLRLVYLALNQREDAPYITDPEGKPLLVNPFRDARVRNAIAAMIDRQALIERVLGGAGEPASQIVPEGVFGYNRYISAPQPNAERARQLLAEAGFPNGFGVTLHGSNDRFSLDAQVAEAVGQMLAEGGLSVNGVETLPYADFSQKAGENAYGAFLFSYGNATGEASAGLLGLLHSYDIASGLGTLNRFRYSNPEFDAAITAASQIFDPVQRENGLQTAAAIAFADTAIVPLYFQSLIWASKDTVDYTPRRDERTLAMEARPATR